MRQNFAKELSKALGNSLYITEKDACVFPPELLYKDSAPPVPRKRALSVKDAKRPDTSNNYQQSPYSSISMRRSYPPSEKLWKRNLKNQMECNSCWRTQSTMRII